ncbi:MAG: outer membrane protein OmpA [Chitinophagaceae bacterium]|nr:outer membrane protein OmpA [Chitinophagaceae bacterium]
MSKLYILTRGLSFVLLCLTAGSLNAQTIKRVQPVWWFGQSVAANINSYNGTTQRLTSTFAVPTAFHEGDGVKPYFSLLTEYRPNKVWGGMLNIAYDNRGGKFETVMAPCNCPATLATNLSYVSIEPSVRVAPFASAFYLFGGPTMGFKVRDEFTYKQEKQADRTAEMSDMRKTVFSAQAGLGFDFPLSMKASATQMTLSPFASFQTDLGRAPRKIESWSIYTIRAGIAIKFGTGRKSSDKTATVPEPETVIVPVKPVVVTPVKEVDFSVRAPKLVPVARQVKEHFPLRNSVFFDMGSKEIPGRYVLLSPAAASTFKEAQLQSAQPDNLNKGRSARQLAVYHNILNIIGDRMRTNSSSQIALSGSSANNPAEGKQMAENVKNYLVTAFGIDGSRITTTGRDKPLIPSEQPGATKDLALLREGDRRVDIMSSSPALLLQVGGTTSSFLRPVEITAIQEDPLDSHVIFTANGSKELLKWWSLEVTDNNGVMQKFGPYAKDEITIPGAKILGSSNTGNYKVALVGETINGTAVRKESNVQLVKAADNLQTGMRYSILFGFDESKSITAYETFLAEIVAPLIHDNNTVIIQGYTDIIGDDNYNDNLSRERAMSSQKVLERAILKRGIKGVKFESHGFGEDEKMTPFSNKLPEGRFYNRTVIIDIVPAI